MSAPTGQRKRRAGRGAAALPIKLTPPVPRRVFARERLYTQLDAALESGHVWVEGPPGAGKTTLAAAYVRQRRLRCLWYRIDGGDADIATFFHYLGEAAATTIRRRPRPLPPFTPECLPNPAAFGRRFFEELRASTRRPLILIFDNYQDVATDAVLHDVLPESLLHVHDGLRAVIVSRGRAPPAFARLQAYAPVTTLRGTDLELSVEEARGIAALRIGAKAAEAFGIRFDELVAQARGWLAGVILLLEGNDAERAPTDAFATDSRQAVFNYFAKEVYERTEPLAQDVLARLAILPEMTAWLAQNLTHSLRAGDILEDLHRRNYFVTHRAQSESYQFHPLFRDFLLERLHERVSSTDLAALRHHAARMLEKRGFIDAAIELYGQATDWGSLVRVVLSHAPELARQSRFATIDGWLKDLPDEVADSEPWVLYWRGACRITSKPAEGRRVLEAAFAGFDELEDSMGLYRSWAGIMETIQIEFSDFHPVGNWITAFQKLRERYPDFPSRDVELSVIGTVVCALAARHLHHPMLPEWLARAEAVIADDVDTPPWWVAQLTWYYLWIGRVDRIPALQKHVTSMVAQSDGSPLLAVLGRVTLAMCEWCLGDPASSNRHVAEGLRLAERVGLPAWQHHLLSQGVYASLARGDPAGAKQHLHQMAGLAGRRGKLEIALFHHLASMAAAHEDDLAAAEKHAATALKMAEACTGQFSIACCVYMYANIALLRGDRKRTGGYLRSLLAIAEETGSRVLAYWWHVTNAIATLRFDGRAAALPQLAEALALSRELQGQSLPFWPHPVLAEIYAVALEHDIETEHVKRLIRRLEVAPAPEHYGLEAWPFAVKVRTLGAFYVQVGDKPLKFSTKSQRKPLELLKTLIALGGKNVSEDRVAEALWPELEADGALRSLASALHRLRKLIGGESVERQDGRLTLNPRRCWTDLWSVQRLLTQIDRARLKRQTERVASIVQSLLALYRGEFLESEGDAQWALGMRERIRRRLHGGLEAAARHLLEAGRHETAIACYQRALDVDPLAESAHRGLIESYLALGRCAEALLAYQRCEQLFQTELGVAPSAQTRALLRGLAT